MRPPRRPAASYEESRRRRIKTVDGNASSDVPFSKEMRAAERVIGRRDHPRPPRRLVRRSASRPERASRFVTTIESCVMIVRNEVPPAFVKWAER
jgi:hypothetical protein